MKKLLLLAVMFLATFVLSSQSEADELFSKAREDFSDKSYRTAVENFNSFLDQYPDDPRADGVNYMRSVSYFYMKQYLDSMNSFRLFESEYGDSAYISRVYYWLGLCSYALRDYEKAAEYFRKQTEYRSERFFVSRSFLYLGESYEKASRPDDAMEAYKQGIIQGGEEKIVSQSRLKLGILYFNSGNYTSASEQFSEIINNSIDTGLVSDSQFYIGESLYHMGELSDAASKLQFYLFMSSNNKFREAAVFRLGDIYQNLGMYEEALKYLQLLLGDYPDGDYYLDGLRVLGRTWKASGDMAKASEVYREVISLSDDSYEVQSYYYELALAEMDSDTPRNAVSLFKEAAAGPDSEKEMMSLYYMGQILMEEDPEEGAAYLFDLTTRFDGTEAADDASVTLAEYLIARGDKHRLALFIGSQLNRDSRHLDRFLFIKGELDEEENNNAEALLAYNRIINEFSDSPYLAAALHRKAGIYIADEREVEAITILDEALREARSDSERTDILVDKALLLYDMGDMEEADYAFTVLLEQDVDFERKGDILFRQGELSLEARNYDESAEYFRRSAEASVGEMAIDALFNMGKSYFHMLNYKTSERIYTDLAEKLSSTSDRKTEAMRMTALSIFLQQDWSRTLQFSDLMVTSLGIYPEEIRLVKSLSLLALGRKEAFEKEVDKNSEFIAAVLNQVAKADVSSALLIFRSLLSAYPEESPVLLAALFITDLMYIVPEDEWIEETYELIEPLLEDDILKIGFQQAYQMNSVQ